MAKSVAELRSLIAAAEAELKRLKDELREAIIRESPFKLGQIYTRQKQIGYRSEARTVTERGVITGFAHDWGTRPVLTLYKADGTLGIRTVEVYDSDGWSLAADATPANPEENDA